MNKAIRILIVEDSIADADRAQHTIRKVLKDCDFRVVKSRRKFLSALEAFQPDVILAADDLPNLGGIDALRLARKHKPFTPFIIWAGSSSVQAAVDCMKAGASTYLLKDRPEQLGTAVLDALEQTQSMTERRLVGERYQAIFENSAEGLFQSSPEGRYVNVNPALAKMYGYSSPAELIESVDDIANQIYLEPEARTHFIELLQKQGRVENYEQRNRCRDGGIIWTSTSARAIRNAEGDLLYIEGFIRDVTARKLMEERLRESESKYRTLVEHLPAITYISGLDQYVGVSYISPQIEMLGFDAKEWLADPELWLGQIHPEDQRQVLAALEQFHRGEDMFRAEYRLVLPDGQIRWFDDRSVRVRDHNGEPVFKQGFMLDITERKQAEEALQQSESRFRALMQNGLDNISLLTPDGTLLWESPSTVRDLGYQPNEFVGRNIFEIMHPDDLEWTSQLYSELIREPGSRKQGTFRLRHADGTWHWMEAIVTNFLQEPGIQAIVVNYRDITERKQAEEALQESRAKYQNLVETSQDLIWSVDPEGSITFLNHAAVEILGWEPEELLGRSFLDLMDRDFYGETDLQKYKEVLSSASAFEGTETYVRHRDGRQIVLSTKYMAIRDVQGKIVGMTGSAHDVTARKQVEAHLNDLLAFNEKILNHSPLGILTYKLTGECVFANEKAALIVGASVEQLQTQNFHTIQSWRESGLYDLVQSAVATHSAATADIHHNSTFGRYIWMTAHCVTFQSKDEEHILLTITDITDRKLAEEQLRQSESRYRLATKATNDVIWERNPETNQLHWSGNAPIVFGYEPGEIAPYAKWWDERLHPDDRERLVAKLNSLIWGEESIWLDEYRFRRKDGSFAYISDRGYVERDENGRPRRMIGAMSDITERKRTESERQALLEIMQGLAHTHDLNDLLKLIHQSIARVIYAQNFFVVLYHSQNGLFEEIYSVDQYDLPEPPSRLEKSITSYVFRSGDPLLLTEARFEELIARDEVRLIGTDSPSWLGVPLKTSGRTIGVMAVQDYERENRYSERDRDFLASIATQVALVIERKQAEETLREQEEHYRAIFEGVQDAILVEAIDGRILMINERACEMFGYSRAEFLTKTVEDLVPPGHLILRAEGTIPPLSAEPFESVNRRANGEIFPIEISGRILVINGESVQLVVVRDITERKQAQTSLLESITQFRTLFEASPDAIMLIDPNQDWTIIDCNTAACQMNGYRRDELIGQPVGLLNLEPGNPEKRGEFLETIRRDGVLYYETLHRRGDGTIITVEVAVSLIKFGSRDIVLGIDRDVTERKRAEADARRHAEARIALYETTHDLVIERDLSRLLQIIVERAARLLNASGGGLYLCEPEHNQVRCVVSHNTTSDFTGLILRYGEGAAGLVAQTGLPLIIDDYSTWEGRAQIYDGEKAFEAVLSVPIKWQDQVIGVLHALSNGKERRFNSEDLNLIISFANQAAIAIQNARLYMLSQQELAERKRAEEAMRESEERFINAFEYAAIGMALLTPEGRWYKVNRSLCGLLGYSEQELLAKTFQDITHPDDLESDLNYVGRLLRGEVKTYQMEKRYFHKQGHVIWILLSVSLLRDDEGNPLYFISQIQDISERRHAEEEMRRRAEETAALLETSQALTDLDLDTILRSISTSAKALFSADGCRIFLMDPDNETLRCVLALQDNAEAFNDLTIHVGEGVTGTVAASGQAEIVNEMQSDPRAIDVPGTPENEAEAIMFAPLKERDHTIGVLSIRRAGEGRHFQSSDLDMLEAFAAMAASAVSNARLFEETQQRLTQLEALYENGLAVGRLLEPRQIGERIIETFARYLRWHHVTIRLKREDSDDLELVAFNLPTLDDEERTSTEEHFIARVNKVGQGLSGWAIQTGKALRTGNVHAHSQYVNTHSEIQSGLYMPLKAGERVIGVISVESEIPDAFSEQDERLLATLASQAAIAFENARLYEAIQRQLSERKRVEDALRVSEAHYRELADSITDILFELDYEMHYTHWNRASEALTGDPASYAIGKSMRDIFGETDEQTRMERIFEEVLRERQPRTFETSLLSSGTERSFEVNAYPSRRGVSVVAKDVTDRKRSETIMQKRFELMEYSAHHTLSELIQRTVDEVSQLTGSTIGFLHFVESDQNQLGLQVWSTNALRLFNVPVSQGAHRPIDQAGLWAEAVHQRRPLIQNHYASLQPKTGLPDGHEPIVRELVVPIIRNEKLVAVLGIANKFQDYTSHDLELAARLADYAWDITERKQMQIALETERNQLVQRVEERTADLSRANSNLARALRVKDEFLANMSHELRTPLNAILGLSESLAEQIAGPLNEKQQKYITTIGESGHHLLALINDILDLAKIEAGQITLDINKVDIHSVCQSSLRMIKQLAQKKNQEVTLKIQDGLGLMWADERRLKQMIVNLLGNAVKFTPENGKIGLEVHGDEEANKVTITVWDNGIGIKPEDLKRLFQPFVQLDSGLARETTGTGLGLALVAQMARLHGGSVRASSQSGSGSHFSIVLPWEPAMALDSATRLRITGKFPAIRPDGAKKPTLLLVEDTKEVIMMIQDYLELAGYQIVTAQDGVDAIVQAKLVRPDLILMDVQMPRMDGIEATRKLRSEPEFRYTPIIALTALAMPNDRERCLSAGMDEYISKPVNLKALVKIIQNCLFSTREPSHS